MFREEIEFSRIRQNMTPEELKAEKDHNSGLQAACAIIERDQGHEAALLKMGRAILFESLIGWLTFDECNQFLADFKDGI